VEPQRIDFEFGIAVEESLVDGIRRDSVYQFAFLQVSGVSVAFAVVFACWTPFGIVPEALPPCGQGLPADIGPLGECGQETPDIWVVEEDGEDWLQFGEIAFVVLVGTSYVTRDGGWRKVFLEPLLQIEHVRRHSG
jgi:hypothetical protein